MTFRPSNPLALRLRAQPALRAWHAWLLAALLLAAQALGLAHRIEHAPGSAAGLRAAWALGSVGLAAAANAAPAPVDGASQAGQGLDGHQAGDAQCRLVDQLGHADVLCGGAWEAPALPPAHRQLPVGADSVAMRPLPAAYQARAPPQA